MILSNIGELFALVVYTLINFLFFEGRNKQANETKSNVIKRNEINGIVANTRFFVIARETSNATDANGVLPASGAIFHQHGTSISSVYTKYNGVNGSIESHSCIVVRTLSF